MLTGTAMNPADAAWLDTERKHKLRSGRVERELAYRKELFDVVMRR
jgi:hypothetical protein